MKIKKIYWFGGTNVWLWIGGSALDMHNKVDFKLEHTPSSFWNVYSFNKLCVIPRKLGYILVLISF